LTSPEEILLLTGGLLVQGYAPKALGVVARTLSSKGNIPLTTALQDVNYLTEDQRIAFLGKNFNETYKKAQEQLQSKRDKLKQN
jgi:hypothetical protein